MCEDRSRKIGQKKKKKRKSTVVSSKKKWTVMNPIRRRMQERNPSSGQNGQLVHWWLLVHSGPERGDPDGELSWQQLLGASFLESQSVPGEGSF
jgi:hypothetical protein